MSPLGYIFNNPNPADSFVGDCVVRAISIAEDISWNDAYMNLCALGAFMHDMPSSDAVWGEFLMSRGYSRHIIQKECKECYRLVDFCRDHPEGTYVVATGNHAIVVINGDYYDTGDSGNCIPIYFYQKEEISE